MNTLVITLFGHEINHRKNFAIDIYYTPAYFEENVIMFIINSNIQE